MKCHKLSLSVFILIGLSSASLACLSDKLPACRGLPVRRNHSQRQAGSLSDNAFTTATANRNSPQELNRKRTGEAQESTRESQESERSRKRDEWQRPGEVMDALGVKPASRVADIGCGFGYFTFRLAARVGAEGKVYAVDLDREAINKVQERKEREKLEQVEPILGESADPHLPNELDAVLIVDSYHEFREYDQTLQAVLRALKPGGRFVIIDGEGPSGRPRTEYHRLHTIPADLVREEVTRQGFVFKESRPGFYDAEYGKQMYFLVFEKPQPNSSPKTTGQSQSSPVLVADAGRTISASRGGSAEAFQIASAILKETRHILIVLPASYAQSAPDRRYPVTVVVDGDYLMPAVATVSDELTRNGQIPESVIVGVENVGGADFLTSNQKRVYDLTPPGLSVSGSNLNQGGDLFLDFIEKELLPAVDRQFRTAAPRTFVGVSSGGVLATYVAATRSTYCAVVSLDAPIHLGDNWLAKKLIARAAVGGAPVRYASLEAKFGWPEEAWKTLVAKAPTTWKLYREKFQLEGHETMQMLGAYLGLRQMFSDYSRFSPPQWPTTNILPYYAQVGASLGATVLPPKRVLQDVINDLLGEGRGVAAHKAYNTLVSGYGVPSDSGKLLARIAEVERHPEPTETVEGLLATPFPTPEEARAFIGEWTGETWMNAEEPRRAQILRIKVVDGRVVGETVHPAAPPEYRVQRWEYLRLTPTGMTWGFMNGMRPRGVILFEGKLEGDTLAGKSHFGGIDFRMPDGSPPPSPAFSFKRVRK